MSSISHLTPVRKMVPPVFDSSVPGIDVGFARNQEALRLHRHLQAMDEPYREGDPVDFPVEHDELPDI